MSLWILFLGAVLGFAATWVVIVLILRFFSRQREPSRDKCFHQGHKEPIPRFGGIALASAFALVCLVAFGWVSSDGFHPEFMVVVLGGLAMFGLGLFDDCRPIGAKLKLVGQITISLAVVAGGVSIDQINNPMTGAGFTLGPWSVLATVVWLILLTNLINIIDGIDGLAAGICLMLMVLLAQGLAGVQTDYPLFIAIGIIGSLLGFLYFNFPPAKIYMGDGGAYFLGFLIGGLTIINSQKGTVAAALVAPLIALALPVLDVALAIVRRGLKGLPIFRPDQRHIHHRLISYGLSRRRTVLTLYVMSLLFLLIAFGVFWSQGRLLPLLLGVAFLVVIYLLRSCGILSSIRILRSYWNELPEIRRETRYAILLTRWLQMEAERSPSPEDLWKNFVFVAEKLGFTEVRLYLQDGLLTWEHPVASADGAEQLTARHEFHHPAISAMVVTGPASAMSRKALELKLELASEAWFNAASRWQTVNQSKLGLGHSGNLSVLPSPRLPAQPVGPQAS